MLTALRTNIQLLYFIILAVVACGLSTSMFLMSVGSIGLAVVWLIEGKFKNKIEILKKNKVALFLIGFYLIHIVGLLYSHNIEYALKDLRVKLPLLLFPFILATCIQLDKKWLDKLLLLFIGAVLVSTVYSFLIHKNIIEIERDLNDPRSISRWISHIRLSLNICLAIFILIFHFKEWKGQHYIWKVLLILWWLYFLYILESATGFSILIFSVFVIFGYLSITSQKTIVRAISLGFLITTTLIVFAFIYMVISQYYQPRDLDLSKLETHTKYGEPYDHDTTNLQLENGNYIWLYVAQNEMEEAWNKKSDFYYSGIDKKGQPIKFTLIRYLTSKGLRKDRDGVNALTKKDIENIENGIATEIILEESGLKRRLKIIVYEFDSYLRGHTPNGSSVTMRFEFWKIGWHVARENWLIGVGTGDIDDVYMKQYRLDKSELLIQYRHRAHNQYLTILITFGVIGFIIFMTSLLLPFILLKTNISLTYLLFFTIVAVSFFGEDTLETQAGVTFYAFFNSLFLFQFLRFNKN